MDYEKFLSVSYKAGDVRKRTGIHILSFAALGCGAPGIYCDCIKVG